MGEFQISGYTCKWILWRGRRKIENYLNKNGVKLFQFDENYKLKKQKLYFYYYIIIIKSEAKKKKENYATAYHNPIT